MPNTYFQVVRTYLQRPFCMLEKYLFISFITLVFTGVSLPFIYIEKQKYFVAIILLLFVFLLTNLVIHVKEQFTDARASLAPYFRKVHGFVATVAAIFFVVLIPAATAMLFSWHTPGVVAITMFLFGIILWSILLLGNKFIPFIWVGCLITLLEPVRNSIAKIISGNDLLQTSVIISIGAILSITGIIKLFLLKEENPEYLRNLEFSSGNSKGCRKWLVDRTAARMIYNSHHAAGSYRSRMLRWNFSNSPLLVCRFLCSFY